MTPAELITAVSNSLALGIISLILHRLDKSVRGMRETLESLQGVGQMMVGMLSFDRRPGPLPSPPPPMRGTRPATKRALTLINGKPAPPAPNPKGKK